MTTPASDDPRPAEPAATAGPGGDVPGTRWLPLDAVGPGPSALATDAEPPPAAPRAPATTAADDGAAGAAGGNGGKDKPPPSHTRTMVEWLLVVGGAVVVALVVKTFLFQAFWIPSPSMSPTLIKGDRVLVNKVSYELHDVHRGDVVVFKRPPKMLDDTIKDLIKRVIGLPGEDVSIRDDHVYINGKRLVEPYTHGLVTAKPPCIPNDVDGIYTVKGLVIPKGEVLVMGDNRTDSADGRCFGPISTKLIVGRAFFIIWPPSKMGSL